MLVDILQQFQYNMQIQGVTQAAISKREQDKEEGKSKRISQANSEQSQLITQRKNNLPPKFKDSAAKLPILL